MLVLKKCPVQPVSAMASGGKNGGEEANGGVFGATEDLFLL
jgi:hypothetical protein